jgi:hypothetical protein
MTPQIESGAAIAMAAPAQTSTNTQPTLSPNNSPVPAPGQQWGKSITPGLPDRYTDPAHMKEWVDGSGSSRAIAAANICSLYGDEAIECVLEGKRGDLRKSTGTYDHLSAGAWFCGGLDPLNNYRPSTIGQLKPNTPRSKPGAPDKALRYESQVGVPPTTIYLDVSDLPHWRSIEADPSIDLVIIEGVKKAGAVATAGIPAIAVTGVENWSRRDEDDNRQLEPRLAKFAVPGRTFVIAYDQETKPESIKSVTRARTTLATTLTGLGCEVKIANWDPSEGKGFDDVAVAHGYDRIKEIIRSATPFDPNTCGPAGDSGPEVSAVRSIPVSIPRLIKKADRLPAGDTPISSEQLSRYTQAALATWRELAELGQALALEPRAEFDAAATRLAEPLDATALDQAWRAEVSAARTTYSTYQSNIVEARSIPDLAEKKARLSELSKALPTMFGGHLEEAIGREIDRAEKAAKKAAKTKARPLDSDPSRPEFSVDDDGVYSHEYQYGEGGLREIKTRIGNAFRAIARTNSTEGSEAGILVEFATQWGVTTRWTVPRRSLSGDLGELLGELLSRGYECSYDELRKVKKYLFGLGSGLTESFTITQKTGWHGNSFVLPHRTIGDQSIRFHSVTGPPTPLTESKGTAEGWRKTTGTLIARNSRLLLATSVPFASALVSLLGVESGFIHLVGSTSKGKTVALTIAASISGEIRIPRWLSTTGGLEAIAAAHNHLPLVIDEIGQAASRDVSASAYMLGNGEGKRRMAKNGSARTVENWALIGLSSGEKTLIEVIEEGGTKVKGGQEVRFPSIPAVPKDGEHGLFDTIHDFSSASEFAEHLASTCGDNSGTILEEYLEHLVQHQADPAWVQAQSDRLLDFSRGLSEGIPDDDGAIRRVARRFALFRLGLELAQEWGVTKFPQLDPEWAIGTCFLDWIEARGGLGSIEVKLACDRLEQVFVSAQHGDRIYRQSEPAASFQNVRDLLAYEEGSTLLVPSSVFKTEFASGVDQPALIAELQRRNWIQGPDSAGKSTHSKRCGPKGDDRTKQRVYVFYKFWNHPEFSEKNDFDKGSETGVPEVNAPQTLTTTGFLPGTPAKPWNTGGVPLETVATQGFEVPWNTGTPISEKLQGEKAEKNKKIFPPLEDGEIEVEDKDDECGWEVT